jgi:hypothetical protein
MNTGASVAHASHPLLLHVRIEGLAARTPRCCWPAWGASWHAGFAFYTSRSVAPWGSWTAQVRPVRYTFRALDGRGTANLSGCLAPVWPAASAAARKAWLAGACAVVWAPSGPRGRIVIGVAAGYRCVTLGPWWPGDLAARASCGQWISRLLRQHQVWGISARFATTWELDYNWQKSPPAGACNEVSGLRDGIPASWSSGRDARAQAESRAVSKADPGRQTGDPREKARAQGRQSAPATGGAAFANRFQEGARDGGRPSEGSRFSRNGVTIIFSDPFSTGDEVRCEGQASHS